MVEIAETITLYILAVFCLVACVCFIKMCFFDNRK